RVRARARDLVPWRAALPRRVGRTGAGLARPGLVPVQGAVRVPAPHLGAMELRPHPRRPDPARVLEADAAGDAAAAVCDRGRDRLEAAAALTSRRPSTAPAPPPIEARSPRRGPSPAPWCGACGSRWSTCAESR